MSQNPYESPANPAVGVNSGKREDLRKVAQYQKYIMYCILANVSLLIAMIIVSQGMQPHAGKVTLFAALEVAYLVVVTAQIASITLLANQVYNLAIGIVVGLFSFFPGVGLLVLLMVNQKATKVLQQNGIKVGFLGADMTQIA